MSELLIKTQASPQIGHGHVMRCIALAEAARHNGLDVEFESCDIYTDALLARLGEAVVSPEDESAKCIIRDFRDGSPVEDVATEVATGSRVLLLDDPGPARLEATLVSDCLMTETRSRECLHSSRCNYLYGLKYAPLRREFTAPIKHDGIGLLICLGGGETAVTTRAYIEALHAQGYRGPAKVICGGDSSERDVIVKLIAEWQGSALLTESSSMAHLFSESHLVVTKVGMLQLESYACGRPTLLIEPSMAHLELSRQLSYQYHDWPAIELGLAGDLDMFEAALETLAVLEDYKFLALMSDRACSLVDGHGSQRLIDILIG